MSRDTAYINFGREKIPNKTTKLDSTKVKVFQNKGYNPTVDHEINLRFYLVIYLFNK